MYNNNLLNKYLVEDKVSEEEIISVVEEGVEDGTLDELIQPLVGDAVSEWLEDNVTPTGSAVVVDASLTISGAAADAKVTGDEISDLINSNFTRGVTRIKAIGNYTKREKDFLYIACTSNEALEIADKLGYPVVLRPAYTMGGAGGGLVYNVEELKTVCARGLQASLVGQVLVEESILGWEELEVEVVRDADNNIITVCMIENIDPLGVHTGDSFCAAPMLTISEDCQRRLEEQAHKIVESVEVIGGTNVQFAHDPVSDRIIVIEINPRTSRSSALASKATGFPIALVSAMLAAGLTLKDIPCGKYGTLDKYVPGGQMWVTESGDAGCGGNTWASTYADVPRTLNELGEFATVTDGIIFHNTLASSDYGYLKHGTFLPRPNYFAVLLWNRIMGTTVYDAGERAEGAHVYAHSRRDGKEGVAYLVVNNSNETTTVELPKEADLYLLSGEETLRSRKMALNGKALELGENDELPALEPVKVSGKVEIPATNCAFIVL
mgnify:CR=1 FL=1